MLILCRNRRWILLVVLHGSLTFLHILLAEAFAVDYLFKNVWIVNDFGRCRWCFPMEQSLLSRMIKVVTLSRANVGNWLAAHLKEWDFLNSGFLSCDPNPLCAQNPHRSLTVWFLWDLKVKENQPEFAAFADCCTVSKKALCLWPRNLYLEPASMQLWQANLLA